MEKYVNLYRYSKKNLDGIKKRLNDYIKSLENVKNIYQDDENLENLINSQKEIVNKIKNNIDRYSKDIKNKAYNLDMGK